MPSSIPAQRFQDILDSIEAIRTSLSTTTREKFARGGMVYDATSYSFLRLAEAAIKLGDLAEQLAPEIPWNNIRGLGNHLRHAYDGIDAAGLWDAAELEFAALEVACREAIAVLDSDQDE